MSDTLPTEKEVNLGAEAKATRNTLGNFKKVLLDLKELLITPKTDGEPVKANWDDFVIAAKIIKDRVADPAFAQLKQTCTGCPGQDEQTCSTLLRSAEEPFNQGLTLLVRKKK